MIRIVEKTVDLEFPGTEGLHVLIAQIPNHIHMEGILHRLKDPGLAEKSVRSILSLARRSAGPDQYHLVLLPESSVPARFHPALVEMVREEFPPNTAVVYGLEHVALSHYADLLSGHGDDNREALETVGRDLARSPSPQPVNSGVALIKERKGHLRCFFFAKTHPFAGEESLDTFQDLYHGKILLAFHCHPLTFHFMFLLCFDYVYRDLHHSNIMSIITWANQLYFKNRQQLDLIAIIQCNPKPEHHVFSDVVRGFYGEYLFRSPGVRGTLTLFANSSRDTTLENHTAGGDFGYSSVVCHRDHRLPAIALPEFSTDNFQDAPVCRMRFGAETRLYATRLFPYHDRDPRSSRSVLKITGIWRPAGEGWERISRDEVVGGLQEEEKNPLSFY